MAPTRIIFLAFLFLAVLTAANYLPAPDEDAVNLTPENFTEIDVRDFAELPSEKIADTKISIPSALAPAKESVKEPELPRAGPAKTAEETANPQNAGNQFTAISADFLEEKNINAESIAAVQCLWDYTYPENVSEDSRFHEPFYSQGSGIVITETGHILTVNHVVENKVTREQDPTGKKWFLKKCEAALTDESASLLPYNSPSFKEAEIVFQPTSEEYDYKSESRADFDFAVLKFKESKTRSFTPMLDMLTDSGLKEKSVFLTGYPGAALTGKREIKTLEFFSDLEKYKGIGTGSSAFFYQAVSNQYKAASDSYKKFQEDLFASGQDDRLVRGGFSGSPVFLKGNLMGIVISSSLPYEETQDTLVILSSYSISELLKKHNFNFTGQ